MRRFLPVCSTIALLLLMFVAIPRVASADDVSTFCKWPQPWPKTVRYYISTTGGQFTANEAVRVAYGGNTWTEAGTNLILQRSYTMGGATNNSRVAMGSLSGLNAVAAVYIYDSNNVVNTNCNVDNGNGISRAVMIWNYTLDFHEDCLAAGTFCQQNGYHDIHNISAHEFGHWFFLRDTYDNQPTDVDGDASDAEETMYGRTTYGETKKRSLTYDDRIWAGVMYGYR